MENIVTHAAAILLHEACLKFQRRMHLEAEGFVAPLGSHHTSEKEYDDFAAQAWNLTGKLLGSCDAAEAKWLLVGSHQLAIYAHQDAQAKPLHQQLEQECGVEKRAQERVLQHNREGIQRAKARLARSERLSDEPDFDEGLADA